MNTLQFLGTCAADFSPLLKTERKDVFDTELRRASCAIIDGHNLIDCGPHAIDALRVAGVALRDIDNLFCTHLHSDHFNRDNVAAVAGAAERRAPLHVWVREDAAFPDIPGVVLHRMKLFTTYAVTDTLSVTGLSAIHDQKATPQWLLLEEQGKKLLYALDGAWFMNDTYYYLENKKVDTAVLDCTVGDYIGDYRLAEHNSIPMLKMMIPSMRTFGILDERSRVYASHMAQTLHDDYEKTVAAAGDFFTVAYDGLTVTI